MSTQDDLTAERAAIALLEQMGLYGHPAASQFIGDILAALQTTRQSCILSREGEEAPKSELQALRDERDRLRANLVNCVARLEAYYGEDYPAVRDAKAAMTPAGQRLAPNEVTE